MALAANQLVNYLITVTWRHYPMLANATIYKGGLVGLTTAGYARALTAGDLFVGVATNLFSETAGTNGSANVEVDTRPFHFALTSVAVTDVGRPVYGSADDGLTFAASNNSYVGVVSRYVSANLAEITPDIAVLTPEGNMAVKTLSATGNQSLTVHDRNKFIIVPNSAALTVTLPAAASLGAGARLIFVKTTAAGAGTAITLATAGSEKINGADTNNTMDAQYDTMEVITDGSHFYICDDVA